MITFLAFRLTRLLLALLFAASMLAGLHKLAPSGPAAMLGNIDRPPAVEEIRKELELDRSSGSDGWLVGIMRGGFGQSYLTGKPVQELLRERAAASLELTLMAMLVALAIGVPLGQAQAARTGTEAYCIADGATLAGQSVPNFLLGLTLVLLIWSIGGPLPFGRYAPLTQDWLRNLASMAMPALALAVPMVPAVTRVVHALARPGKPPEPDGRAGWRKLLAAESTHAAPELVALLSGLVIIERIFDIPGLGRLFYEAAVSRDFPVLAAVGLLAVAAAVVLVFVADLACALAGRREHLRAVASVADGGASRSSNRAAIAGLSIVGILLVALVFEARQIGDSETIDLSHPYAPPSAASWLGTDAMGRDVLDQVVAGIRPALASALIPVGIALGVGIPFGLIAGGLVRWGGGVGAALDALVGSVTDALLALPFLVFAITSVSVHSDTIADALVAMAFWLIPIVARRTRGRVIAGRTSGARPGVVATLAAETMVLLAVAMAGFAAASALGFGPPRPASSWGVMIGTSAIELTQAPWVATSAGLALILATLGFNLIAIGLRGRVGRAGVAMASQDARP